MSMWNTMRSSKRNNNKNRDGIKTMTILYEK